MASLIAQLVKNPPVTQDTPVWLLDGKIRWRRDRLLTPVFLSFPGVSTGKESACNTGDLGSVPELGRSPGEGKGYSLQYCDLKNSMDCIVHGVAKSRTCPSNFHTSHTLLNRYLYLIHWMSTSKEVFVTWIIFIFLNNAIWMIPEDWVRTTF